MRKLEHNTLGGRSPADEVKIQRGTLTLFLVAASVFLAWFGVSRGMPLIGLAIPGVAIVSWLLSRPEVLLMVTLFMQGTNMKFPGLSYARSGRIRFLLIHLLCPQWIKRIYWNLK